MKHLISAVLLGMVVFVANSALANGSGKTWVVKDTKTGQIVSHPMGSYDECLKVRRNLTRSHQSKSLRFVCETTR